MQVAGRTTNFNRRERMLMYKLPGVLFFFVLVVVIWFVCNVKLARCVHYLP